MLTTSPIPNGGVVAVLRDVTREHEYQEELSKLSIVASSTSNLVVITDAVGRIDWVNPAFEETTGYRLDEVRGRTPGSFLQGADTDQEAVDADPRRHPRASRDQRGAPQLREVGRGLLDHAQPHAGVRRPRGARALHLRPG